MRVRERSEDTPDLRPRTGETETMSVSREGRPAEVADLRANPLEGSLRAVARSEYEIEAEAGRGGTGVVYRARDVRLDRVVAVKELSRPDTASQLRFQREMRITARLQHPGIVPVHEAGRWPSGEAFYAMKLVEGRPLHQLVKEAPTFEARLGLLAHVISIADAIAYAHGQGVIHRDLKPSNVIIGAYGEVVVIDWGLAKDLCNPVGPSVGRDSHFSVRDLDATRAGAIMGTPGFMAPEQARGDEADERTDIYALGAILYKILGGRAPYIGDIAEDLIDRVRTLPPPPLLELEPRVPRELVTIVDKAMAREQSDRYSSAQQFVDDLKRFQQGQLVAAHVYSRRDLIARWLRRHRAMTLVVAAASLVLLVVAAGAYRSVISERDRWKRERVVAVSRANQLLLQQARASLASDPTASLAALSAYPVDGPDWAEVQEIASEASARGVARHIWRDFRDDVINARFVDQGRRVLSTSDDGRLVLADAATGLVVASHQGAGSRSEIALSPSGRLAAVAGFESAILLLDLNHPETLVVLQGHTGAVNAVTFLPDEDVLISVASDGQVRRWPDPLRDPTQSQAIASVSDPIMAVAVLRRAGEIAFGTGSGLVQVRDPAGKLLREWQVGSNVVKLEASQVPGGTALACATSKGQFWRLDVDREKGRLLHTSASMGYGLVRFSPASDALALAGTDGEVWLHEPSKPEGVRLSKEVGEIYALAFSADGRKLAAGGERAVVNVWSLSDGHLRTRVGHVLGIYTLAFAPDGKSIVSGGDDETLRLWNLVEPTPVVLRGPNDNTFHVQIDTADRWVASDGRDGSIYLWDLATYEMRRLGTHRDLAYGLARSPDATRIASASWDGTARVWPIDGGPGVELIGHRGIVWDVAFSPSGARLATAGADGTIRVWHADGRVERVLTGHEKEARGVLFAGDDTLVSSGRDGTVRVWDIDTGRMRVLRGHTGEILRLTTMSRGRVGRVGRHRPGVDAADRAGAPGPAPRRRRARCSHLTRRRSPRHRERGRRRARVGCSDRRAAQRVPRASPGGQARALLAGWSSPRQRRRTRLAPRVAAGGRRIRCDPGAQEHPDGPRHLGRRPESGHDQR
jgi:WD40 repeat protein/tRNA A-37 threonylcarbamoyl transferase component Bud32